MEPEEDAISIRFKLWLVIFKLIKQYQINYAKAKFKNRNKCKNVTYIKEKICCICKSIISQERKKNPMILLKILKQIYHFENDFKFY